MFNDEAPCKGCEERHPGCHDSCGKYKAWKAEAQRKSGQYREYKRQRREDFLHSEECLYRKRRFRCAVNKWDGGKNHGR